MATDFTPGPWKWWTSNSWCRLKRDDRGITQSVLEPFVSRDGHPDCSVSKADMALIAAAPEMFEALEYMADLFKDLAGDPATATGWKTDEMLDVYQRARAALRKARGEA